MLFAPDGGANSIAGIEIAGDAGDNLVHLFAQWGLEQLILAIIAWIVMARYRFLRSDGSTPKEIFGPVTASWHSMSCRTSSSAKAAETTDWEKSFA